MLVLTPENAPEVLRSLGLAPRDRRVLVEALTGGVSNLVLRVTVEDDEPYVLKQSREQLRTKAEWFSRLNRIWIERDALELLAGVLPEASVPKVLYHDEPNYLLAITHAPAGSYVWKERLLVGGVEIDRGRQAGELLASMHAGLVGSPGLDGRLADTEVFDQLRIDPYYRTVARAHPTINRRIEKIINQLFSARRRTFVHADFSPKNILVHDRGLFVVDFETAHSGDPAFDLGFFLSHLVLKAMRDEPGKDAFFKLAAMFWQTYHSRINNCELAEGLESRGLANAFACLLARIDGKSPVDYLDEAARERSALQSRGGAAPPSRKLVGIPRPVRVSRLLEKASFITESFV